MINLIQSENDSKPGVRCYDVPYCSSSHFIGKLSSQKGFSSLVSVTGILMARSEQFLALMLEFCCPICFYFFRKMIYGLLLFSFLYNELNCSERCDRLK